MSLPLEERFRQGERYKDAQIRGSMVEMPSPAIAVVGRHNSGKTTLVVKLVSELAKRGYDVGSIKHHSHGDFDIDHPGKDSYRHREAGATETVIASPTKMARVKTLDHEVECSEIVASMPGHDIVVVEGYRKSGLPTIEVFRAANDSDKAVALAFAESAKNGVGLGVDHIQEYRNSKRGDLGEHESDIVSKMPTSTTVAIVTDIPEAINAAESYGIPSFGLDAISDIVAFLEERYVRPKVTVVIQAGGESKRMGQSKALVEFNGRPLICRLVRRLLPAADELVITTNEPDKLGFLKDEFPETDIRLVSDNRNVRGALIGMETALEAAGCPIVAVVACDMVFASPSLVVAEAIEMTETGADAVVPVNKHGYEPFHASYRKETCLAAVKRALADGKSRVQSIFQDSDIRVIEFPQSKVVEVEPRGGCFINTNTPEELAHIEKTYLGE